jgi:hypothetical protein
VILPAASGGVVPAGYWDMEWTRAGLREAGFTGFVPFAEFLASSVPAEPGVYMVVRPDAAPPRFLSSSCAGWFKRKDPSVSVELLEQAWLPGATVVYIGKAGRGKAGDRGLRSRLEEYHRFGRGEPVGHSGGRYIWQLADSDQLLVAWRETPEQDSEAIEDELLADFVAAHGALPFANLRSARSSPGTRR